ncbi:protein TIC 56, chloroplastic-like [Primulina eburnea]|uniref:protein TIC 56, chloroplastic-like n=1 Tax=Primulina eburnea TaxID=1245227 RepID=UPI003C6BF2A2
MDEWHPLAWSMVWSVQLLLISVRLGAAATAFLHKLRKGIPPWVPLKGHENKTYKQLPKKHMRAKDVTLEANDGIWPGSHAMFLWADGSELTTLLEEDHMPNRYIPKNLRIEMAKVIPGLRPWEVLSVEQAMDQITYGGKWHREPLGSMQPALHTSINGTKTSRDSLRYSTI